MRSRPHFIPLPMAEQRGDTFLDYSDPTMRGRKKKKRKEKKEANIVLYWSRTNTDIKYMHQLSRETDGGNYK